MARQLGIVIGVALLVTVLGTPARATALTYFGHAFVLTAALAVAAGLASLLLIPAGKKAAAVSPAGALAGAVPGAAAVAAEGSGDR
jgi:hypothetical protein